MAQKWTLSPRFKWHGKSLVQTTSRAGCNSHQFFRDFADFVGAHPADKHLGQCSATSGAFRL
jgi:hypothetical protein